MGAAKGVVDAAREERVVADLACEEGSVIAAVGFLAQRVWGWEDQVGKDMGEDFMGDGVAMGSHGGYWRCLGLLVLATPCC